MESTAVSTILKEGTIINTKLEPGLAWFQNIVYKCEEDTVCISLIDDYLRNCIFVGANILLKYTNEYFEYLFWGTVTNISPQHPAHIHLQVNKAEEIVNTRIFPRYDTYIAADIKSIWNNDSHFCIVTNICLGGMAFVSKHKFEYGEECEVSVYLSAADNEIIFVKGKVIRRSTKNNIIDYSMQYIEMDEENSNMLSDYLQSIEGEHDSLQNHFFAHIRNNLK